MWARAGFTREQINEMPADWFFIVGPRLGLLYELGKVFGDVSDKPTATGVSTGVRKVPRTPEEVKQMYYGGRWPKKEQLPGLFRQAIDKGTAKVGR